VPLVFAGDGSAVEPPAAPRPASAAPPAAPRAISVSWVGDITLGSRYGLPPENGRPLFRAVRSRLVRSDVTLGNLEGTLSVGGTSKCGTDGGQCFSFQAPPENAQALRWAGFDLMSLANNHTFDFGADGQQQTLEALEHADVEHTGLPGQVTTLRRGGVTMAIVGFAPYPWSNDPRDLAAVEAVVADAQRAADVVIVLAHLGSEGSDQTHVPVGAESLGGEDRGDTRAFAHAAVDAGADLVLGSGPHVLRGMELYRDKLIAYSLGNFAGWHNFATSGVLSLSGVLTVRISPEGELVGGRLASVRLDSAGVPAMDASGAAATAVSALGTADFGPAAVTVSTGGGLRAPAS